MASLFTEATPKIIGVFSLFDFLAGVISFSVEGSIFLLISCIFGKTLGVVGLFNEDTSTIIGRICFCIGKERKDIDGCLVATA